MKKVIIALLALVCTAGQAKEETVVWEHPSTEVNTEIEGYFHTLLEITRVELAKDETRLMLHIANRPENWVRISSASYLLADGKRYALRSLDGMEADKETFLTENGSADVVLHFAPLPMKTKCFDFAEGDTDGAWKLLGIEDVATRAERIFPSNWRDVQTGQWDISFYEDFAIYDCKFWNYKQHLLKGDRHTFVLENGGREVTVLVGGNKKGCRTITIDGAKGEYSYISTITLPDYPRKDVGTDFKDTHYRTDTATLVGWLKDMPQWMKDEGRAYEVSYENLFTDEQTSSYDKMDSLGRFVIKIPLQGATEIFADWKRTFIRTLIEPGETYFLLYDFKGGHKMFMGRNCRLQNETLAHPIAWVGGRAEKRDMDEEEAMAFLETVKAEKAKAMQELDEIIARHPNVSSRFISYLKGHYRTSEGEALMQGRFSMKDRHVPAEYLDYVGREIWQKTEKPYTLYRDFSTFMRDYIGQLVSEKYDVRGPKHTFTMYYDMFSPVLRRYRAKGKVAISDEELAVFDNYAEEAKKYQLQLQTEGNEEQATEEFSKKECVKQIGVLFERNDIKEAIQAEAPLMPLYHTLDILDSMQCDKELRDIILTRELYEILDNTRTPLGETVMQYFEENVGMPDAKDFLRAEQEKYLSLQRKDISKSENLKSADSVADMSDGEQILRKLIEPYRGKLILLDIWGTWCGPCKDALSRSQAEYKRLEGFDLVYLYLANGSSEESWKNVIKMYDVTGDNVVHYNLPTAQQSAIEAFLKVHAFPTYKLIDREGNVLDVNADPRDLEGLARLLEQMK